MVCAPQAGDDNTGVTLERSHFELGELDWIDALTDPGGIEFNLPIGRRNTPPNKSGGSGGTQTDRSLRC